MTTPGSHEFATKCFSPPPGLLPASSGHLTRAPCLQALKQRLPGGVLRAIALSWIPVAFFATGTGRVSKGHAAVGGQSRTTSQWGTREHKDRGRGHNWAGRDKQSAGEGKRQRVENETQASSGAAPSVRPGVGGRPASPRVGERAQSATSTPKGQGDRRAQEPSDFKGRVTAFLDKTRKDFHGAPSKASTAAATSNARDAPPTFANRPLTVAEAVSSLVSPRQQQQQQQRQQGQGQGGARPLAASPGSCPSSPSTTTATSPPAPPRFDPKLLPDVVRVFQRASSRLGFTTQLPHAVAGYVVAASRQGTLDLASCDLATCKALVLFLGQAQVVNRDCLNTLRKALQGRWSQLRPPDLVELLVGLKALNDADRCTAVGRPGMGASRLLHMLLDAEPSVMALLQGPPAGVAGAGQSNSRVASLMGGMAAAAAAAAAGGERGGGGVRGGGGGRGRGGRGGVRAQGGSGVGEEGYELPAGAAVQLALAYLSFHATATSGKQHFAMVPMLLSTLTACLARLEDGDLRQRVPADELGRLVAGLAAVALLPHHALAPHLPRLVKAVLERSGELSPLPRALLLELRPGHWAFPEGWRDRLMAAVVGAAGEGQQQGAYGADASAITA